MGGSSKSSSSTTNQNFNYDERIGAENSVVYSNNIDGNNNTVTDLGAINKSFDTMLEFSDGMLDFANSTRSESFEAINKNTKLAFDWANNASISADERVVNKLVPTLIIAVAVVAIFYVMKGKK